MAELGAVDPSIWRACAGTCVKIPTVDSRVYYFPQGHAEQSSSPPTFSPLAQSRPSILCRVLSVRFLADPDTDEAFAKIQLLPIDPSRDPRVTEPKGADGNGDGDGDDQVVSFAKILTPSDANNGGGFSVPRFCADSIFPPLNFAADPPVQNIFITDVHGAVWEFRHIYRGTPRRHLLTTGWSKFVNGKKLVAGDSVVFMRNSRNRQLFVGVRRAVRSNADCGWRWDCPAGLPKEEENVGGGLREGFSRKGGRVSAESVSESAELAAQGMVFEIVYYPRAGCGDFVVRAEVVEESLNVFWTAGMRVKMAMETEDSSRMTWFQGTAASAFVPENGPWRGSPWQMLQVTWDELEVLQNVKRVSPWQVEYVVPTDSFHSTFPCTKKFRVSDDLGLLPDGDGEFFFPMTGLSSSMMGQLNPALINYVSFPAGMQGARQDQICVSRSSNFFSDNNHQMNMDDFVGNTMTKVDSVSTELNIGSSQSDNLSPDSQSSIHCFATELVGKQGCNSSTKVGFNSIQLFGKIIHMDEPVEGGFHDVGCTEDEGSRACKESEGLHNALDLSLTYPYAYDNLDVQYQRGSAIEACSS